MAPLTRFLLGIAACVVALAFVAPLYLYVASEAVIQRRYPLTSTTAHADMTPKEIQRGSHLVTIAGCADCHGANLQGRLLHAGKTLPVYAGNLLRDAQSMSDEELERAIRYAIKPDAMTMWVMPSEDYAYMSENDVASIVSYLRSRPLQGRQQSAPQFDNSARSALLEGRIEPQILAEMDSPSSLDMGPRYDGGRYLARITCGECHGTDLKGRDYAPDLSRIMLYSRADFFALLREGRGTGYRYLPVMHRIARARFHAFADYEIMALYDYLDARAHAPPKLIARADALRRHEEEQKRLLESGQ